MIDLVCVIGSIKTSIVNFINFVEMLSNPELAFGLSFMAELYASDGVTGPRKKLC